MTLLARLDCVRLYVRLNPSCTAQDVVRYWDALERVDALEDRP